MKQAYPIGAQTLRMPLYTPDAVLPMRYGFRYTIQRGLDNFQAAAGAVNGLMVGTVDDGKRRVELCKGRRERLNEVKTVLTLYLTVSRKILKQGSAEKNV